MDILSRKTLKNRFRVALPIRLLSLYLSLYRSLSLSIYIYTVHVSISLTLLLVSLSFHSLVFTCVRLRVRRTPALCTTQRRDRNIVPAWKPIVVRLLFVCVHHLYGRCQCMCACGKRERERLSERERAREGRESLRTHMHTILTQGPSPRHNRGRSPGTSQKYVHRLQIECSPNGI